VTETNPPARYDDSEPLPAAPRPTGLGRLTVALIVLAAVLAVTSIALALVDRSARQDRSDLARARNAAAQAAGQLVLNLDALSVKTIDADMARVSAQSTGQFKKQFTGSQAQLKKYVVERQITSKGELQGVGVVRSDLDTATVIVAVDRTFRDKTHKDGVVAKDRWKVTLERRNGEWLVAELEPVA
jgi:Mce-associated membrane protein